MDSDSELLQRFAATGDEAAFTSLVSRHAGMVRGVAWQWTRDWTAAEDIAQNVFAVLARKAPALRHERLAGWLHRAAVLESRNAARKTARHHEALRHLRDHATPPPPPEDTGLKEWRSRLDDALSRLPAEARHLVVLRYLERRSLADIAAASGKPRETCRKCLQRSLRRLEILLRRGGPPRTGPALAPVIFAQGLGMAPATAAPVTAALQTTPSFTVTWLAAPALHLMNATTIAKTAALTLVLAAIPLTLLWRENAELKASVRRLSTPTTEAARPPAPLTPRSPSVLASGAETGPGKGATTAPATNTPERMLQAKLEKGRDKVRRLADAEFTRLSLNLPDLTDEQKSRIRESLERKGLAELEDILRAFQSGAVARWVQNPENLAADEKAALAKIENIDPRKPTPTLIDGELRAILTPEQYATHLRAQEARRVTEAEESASDTLKFIGRSFDLTPEQKDQIFQQLAQHALAPSQPAPATAENEAFPEIGSREQTRDQIIRASLTPQQAEVFDQIRAAERETLRQQMMEFYAQPQNGADAE